MRLIRRFGQIYPDDPTQPREFHFFLSLAWRHDRYQFDQTGLEANTSVRADPAQEELITEKRRVFGEICEAANHRLLWMKLAAERDGPPPQGLKGIDANIEKLPRQKSKTLNG